jgi:hypothetical protein
MIPSIGHDIDGEQAEGAVEGRRMLSGNPLAVASGVYIHASFLKGPFNKPASDMPVHEELQGRQSLQVGSSFTNNVASS